MTLVVLMLMNVCTCNIQFHSPVRLLVQNLILCNSKRDTRICGKNLLLVPFFKFLWTFLFSTWLPRPRLEIWLWIGTYSYIVFLRLNFFRGQPPFFPRKREKNVICNLLSYFHERIFETVFRFHSQMLSSVGGECHDDNGDEFIDDRFANNGDGVALKYFVRDHMRKQYRSQGHCPIRIMTLSESKLLYPDVPHSWLCDGKLLRLLDAIHPGNYTIFQVIANFFQIFCSHNV